MYVKELRPSIAKIGYIAGLCLNAQGETILLVKWAGKQTIEGGTITPMHPANVKEPS